MKGIARFEIHKNCSAQISVSFAHTIFILKNKHWLNNCYVNYLQISLIIMTSVIWKNG